MMPEPDIKKILARHPPGEESLIEILHDIEIAFRHLPMDLMPEVARHACVPLAKVASVATFYKAFSFIPRGEVVLRICMGTTCHVKGARLIREETEKILKIKPGETTRDGKYSLEVVNCVGACAMAPVIVENETYHGQVSVVDLGKLLDRRGGGE